MSNEYNLFSVIAGTVQAVQEQFERLAIETQSANKHHPRSHSYDANAQLMVSLPVC